MKVKYRRFVRRGGMFCVEDIESRKQTNLGTKDRKEALRLLHAKNESYRAPSLNLQMGQVCLSASDYLTALKFRGSPRSAASFGGHHLSPQ